jgi:hypothetical protein
VADRDGRVLVERGSVLGERVEHAREGGVVVGHGDVDRSSRQRHPPGRPTDAARVRGAPIGCPIRSMSPLASGSPPRRR